MTEDAEHAKPASGATPLQSPPEDDRGRRPAFAADFPRDTELDALVEAFDQGDFARVRDGAARIASSGSDDAVKRAAGVLLARTRPDPLATLLLALSALLLVLLSAWWILHDPND